jgi:cell division protein FtsI (penicillin-binding protein 3)
MRTYPNGSVAGNLTGYVSTDGPGGGLELGDNSCLASKNGTTTYEQGADGVQIPGSEITNTASQPGGTLKLSIDSDLQWFATQAIAEQGTAIGAQSATAVVLRVKDFHLMAVADWPPVDPNNVDASAVANYGSLAFTAQYEPGSVLKAISASALIDTGIGSPTMQAVVPSHWVTPEGAIINDAAPHPEQHLTLTGVLQNSSNVGISKLGSEVPEQTRLDYMKKFGLGQATAVGFPGEATGLINKLPWDNQTHYNVLYGQGVSATALQIAQIFGTLGNGGLRLPTTLVESCTKADGTVIDQPSTAGTRVVSESTAKTVVNMLESVVQGGELSKAVKIPGYRVAGKSGTAEVASNGRYTGDRVVSFAGIAPAEDPQYVVVVTYTKPATMKSSAAAAPTFKKIMSQVLTKYRVPPSTTPSTYPATTW